MGTLTSPGDPQSRPRTVCLWFLCAGRMALSSGEVGLGSSQGLCASSASSTEVSAVAAGSACQCPADSPAGKRRTGDQAPAQCQDGNSPRGKIYRSFSHLWGTWGLSSEDLTGLSHQAKRPPGHDGAPLASVLVSVCPPEFHWGQQLISAGNSQEPGTCQGDVASW